MPNAKVRRYFLYARDPHCHWCGVETVLAAAWPTAEPPPDNFATVDHVYSKLDPRRYEPGGDETVLACYGCNNRRNLEEMAEKRWSGNPFKEKTNGHAAFPTPKHLQAVRAIPETLQGGRVKPLVKRAPCRHCLGPITSGLYCPACGRAPYCAACFEDYGVWMVCPACGFVLGVMAGGTR